jgi:hypothetical protein
MASLYMISHLSSGELQYSEKQGIQLTPFDLVASQKEKKVARYGCCPNWILIEGPPQWGKG